MSLEGCPAAELLTTTAKVWAECICAKGEWYEDADAQRFRDAFMMLIRHSQRWPSVSQFLHAMPSRAESEALRLTRRTFTDEERAENLRKLSRLIDGIPGFSS